MYMYNIILMDDQYIFRPILVLVLSDQYIFRPILVLVLLILKFSICSNVLFSRSSKIPPSLSVSYPTSQDSVISRHLPSSSSSSSSLVHQPRHMTTYNTHARMLKNKYQFQPKKLTTSTKGMLLCVGYEFL